MFQNRKLTKHQLLYDQFVKSLWLAAPNESQYRIKRRGTNFTNMTAPGVA